MSTHAAPYRHSDGSNCWTKNCSRDNGAANSFSDFLAWAGATDASSIDAGSDRVKRLLPGNLIRKSPFDFIRAEEHRAEYRRMREIMPKEQWDAINHYMQYGYRKVNAYLRGGAAWTDFLAEDRAEKVDRWGYEDWSETQLEQEADELINRLDVAFATVQKHYPAKEQTLYRYEMVPPSSTLEDVKARYPVGGTVHLPAYTSTSINPNLMVSVANRDDLKGQEQVIFEIVSHRGIDLHSAFGLSGGVTAEEQEVLLPRDGSYRVHRVIEAPYQTGYDVKIQERLGYFGYTDNWKKPVIKKRFTIIQLVDVSA